MPGLLLLQRRFEIQGTTTAAQLMPGCSLRFFTEARHHEYLAVCAPKHMRVREGRHVAVTRRMRTFSGRE